jgi:hypothetical protein
MLREHSLTILQNSALRKIFGPEREEERRDWRKRYNEEIRSLCSSANITRVINSMRIRGGEGVWNEEGRR